MIAEDADDGAQEEKKKCFHDGERDSEAKAGKSNSSRSAQRTW